MTKPLQKILVVRNDKLGDFMLALPSFTLLKQALPESSIYALVPEYTQDMAQAFPHIDHILLDPGSKEGTSQLTKIIKSENFDAVITLFSTERVGWALFRAGIPYRLAPATKIAQIFYNHRLTQRRSRSLKPEYEYNLDLIRQFLKDHHVPIPEQPAPPILQFDDQEIKQLKQSFCQDHEIDPQSRIVFVHSGSGGSANNLTLEQYANLITNLAPDRLHIVLTAGPGEYEAVQQVAAQLANTAYTIYQSSEGLVPFAKHIQFADLFISGSTGPLHIAGALNRPTAGFYPRRRSSTPLRWQTCNETQRRLAFTPPPDSDESDMSGIDIIDVAEKINRTFLRPN